MSSTALVMFAGEGDSAMAACSSTGTIVSSNCDTSYVQLNTGTGTATITVTDHTTGYIEMKPNNSSTTPTSHTMTISGTTVVNNSSYSAIYSMTSAASHDISVYIGSGVSATSNGGSGAVWLRNETSGNLYLETSGTLHATGGPAATLTTNLGDAILINNGSATSTDDRGLYADGGYNNAVGSPATVSITNNGTVSAYTAGVRAINYRGTASITNTGTVTSTTRQGLVNWSAAGGATISNSGTVTAYDDIGLQAWSTGGTASITNSGSVSAYNDTARVDAGSGHYGVYAYSETSGDISVTNTASGSIYAPQAAAIYAEADRGKISISNAGTVNGLDGILAKATGGGIEIDNSGTLKGNDNSAYADTSTTRYGIRAQALTSGAITITNRAFGTILARDATAIVATADLGTISITNGGSISGVGGLDLTASNGAIEVVNSGTLSATGGGSQPGQVTPKSAVKAETTLANGITVSNLSGGTISASSAAAVSVKTATGRIAVSNAGRVTGLTGVEALSSGGVIDITNSGTIDSSGSDQPALKLETSLSGTVSISNTAGGEITAANATAVTAKTAAGSLSINNAGRISGLAGIEAVSSGGVIDIVNSGTIAATRSTGVAMKGARLTNSGVISGAGYGVSLDTAGNSVTNSGKISGGVASVYFGTGGNTLNITPGAVFTGVVDYNRTSGNTTTFGPGSYRIPASNYIHAANTISLNNSSQRLLLSTPDTTGTINVIAALPTANMANQYTNSVSDVIGSILSLDVARPGDTPGRGEEGSEALGYAEEKPQTPAQRAINQVSDGAVVGQSGTLFWARVFGGGRIQHQTAVETPSLTRHYGMIAGADRLVGGYRIGGFAGAGAIGSKASDSGNTIDGYTGFAGVYGATDGQHIAISGSFTVGGIDNDSQRVINGGSEWATGSFWGWYLSPEVSIGRTFDIATGWRLTPSARLRYVGAFYDGFTESGSTQNLNYESRQAHSLDGRLQMELAHRSTNAAGRSSMIAFSAALLSTQKLGDSDYLAKLDNAEFTMTDQLAANVQGAMLGLSFDMEIGPATSAYGGFEGAFFTDSSVTYSGRLGIKTVF